MAEVESRFRLAAASKPEAVKTAPTPPPSPPELRIDETKCQPDNESSPPKDRELPRIPDIDLLSKSPRTPKTPNLDHLLLDRSVSGRPSTPDLNHPSHPTVPVRSNVIVNVIKTEPVVVAQSQSKWIKRTSQLLRLVVVEGGSN